jgi:protein-S-isoprenylcysteine O-methyltransferase Ste14
MTIKNLAVIGGLAVILAPLARLIISQGRDKSRTIGSGSFLRSWPASILLTAAWVVIGILLWKPLPLEFSVFTDRFLTILGSSAYFPGIALYLWGLTALGREFGITTTGGADLYSNHQLVRKGPYRWVRHPMYLAVLLAAGGALLIFQTWAMLVFTPLSLVVVQRAANEERLLAEEFPDEWREYSREVPKWLPRCYKER